MGVKKKKNGESVQNGGIKPHHETNGSLKETFPDPFAVTWAEKYSAGFEKVWSKIPKFLGAFIVTSAICTMGLGISGDWLLILVHSLKQYRGNLVEDVDINNVDGLIESLRLKNFSYFWLGATAVSYIIYYGIGGFLHWYFYVRQRDRPHEWKCQPTKFMSPELERHEIIFGSLTLFLNSTATAMVACYISNGGYSTIYYNISDYPTWWFFLQFVVIFVYQDYATYLLHRLYHVPFLYKHFHKMHHKYKQPTAFSVTAIHPVESIHIQLTLILPIFVIPLHWGPFYIVALYTYYHGIIDHSGINFKAYWWQPWQPDAIFHDNHHQYFHVNFAFNIYFWDILHGTYRRKDRVYTEDIFYGRGKELTEATAEELKTDIEERKSENPKAYRGDKLVYILTDKDLQEQDIKTTVIKKKKKKYY
ncbi:Fatty acid hydroxylase [Popillia japonica]|uniref:Fatty acid hydroxylase n=1 Tax=Popillia japonica TaxID=7064 RepID=A0AAW1KH81_POPJA